MEARNLRAVALIAGDKNVRGCLQFVQDTSGTTHVTGKITGLSPGFHGFHIHSFGDTTNGCNSTGPHFNPLNRVHGAPDEEERHAGDLGNILAGSDGIAEISIKDKQIPLSGQYSILGRAVVVHADPDDLGKDVKESYDLFAVVTEQEDTSLANQREMQARELDAVSSDFNHLWMQNYSC